MSTPTTTPDPTATWNAAATDYRTNFGATARQRLVYALGSGGSNLADLGPGQNNVVVPFTLSEPGFPDHVMLSTYRYFYNGFVTISGDRDGNLPYATTDSGYVSTGDCWMGFYGARRRLPAGVELYLIYTSMYYRQRSADIHDTQDFFLDPTPRTAPVNTGGARVPWTRLVLSDSQDVAHAFTGTGTLTSPVVLASANSTASANENLQPRPMSLDIPAQKFTVGPSGAVCWATYNVQSGNNTYENVIIACQDANAKVDFFADKHTGLGPVSLDQLTPLTPTAPNVVNTTSSYDPMFGSHTVYVRITLPAKPTAPVTMVYTDPLSLYFSSAEELAAYVPKTTFTWSPPAHDGGLPVSGYTVHSLTPDGKVTAKRLNSTVRTYELTAPFGTRAWLTADNDAGSSEPVMERFLA